MSGAHRMCLGPAGRARRYAARSTPGIRAPGGGDPSGAVAASGRDDLVREAGRDGVDGVVEHVDGDFLAPPEHDGGAMSSAGRVTRRCPRPPRRGRRSPCGRHAGRAEEPAHDAPAGAVAPVERSLKRATRAPSSNSRCRAPWRWPWPARSRTARPRSFASSVLETRHRGGAGDAGEDALADRAREPGQRGS